MIRTIYVNSFPKICYYNQGNIFKAKILSYILFSCVYCRYSTIIQGSNNWQWLCFILLSQGYIKAPLYENETIETQRKSMCNINLFHAKTFFRKLSSIILKPVWFLAFQKTKSWLQLSPDWKTPRTFPGQKAPRTLLGQISFRFNPKTNLRWV